MTISKLGDITSVIFDLDDTLIVCGTYYIQAKDTFANWASEITGVPKEVCRSVIEDIDIANTTTAYGWSRHRLPVSFAAAKAALDILGYAGEVNVADLTKAREMANKVFDAPYELIEGAVETLQHLVDNNITLYLFTKGDHDIQTNKILKNGLGRFFPVHRTHIVSKKTPQILIDEVMYEHGLNRHTTLLVGDSVKDDIGSAYALGIRSVLVHTGLHWAYEDSDHIQPTAQIASVANLTGILSLSPTSTQSV